jgi:hypothetical protein
MYPVNATIVLLMYPENQTSKKSSQSSTRLKGIKALAEFLGVSVSTAHKYKSEGLIPYYQVGGIVFFDSDEVINSMKKGGSNES